MNKYYYEHATTKGIQGYSILDEDGKIIERLTNIFIMNKNNMIDNDLTNKLAISNKQIAEQYTKLFGKITAELFYKTRIKIGEYYLCGAERELTKAQLTAIADKAVINRRQQ